MHPPLAVDIDGTLTGPDRRLDPRVLSVLRAWAAPVVVATGKALPYPVALCEFVGVEPTVIAENGGVTVGPDAIEVIGDRTAADAVVAAYRSRGYGLGWDGRDLANRWRETEVVVHRDQPLEPLQECARAEGLEVVDSGYAYHVKSPAVSKGAALEEVADALGLDPSSFAAIGDSANDVALFERVGTAIAVGNAAPDLRAVADAVTDASYADGFLEATTRLEEAPE